MAGCINLCKVGDLSGNFGQVVLQNSAGKKRNEGKWTVYLHHVRELEDTYGITPARRSPGSCFAFVSHDDISIREDFFHLNFEELHEERG